MVTFEEFIKKFEKLPKYLNDMSADLLMKREQKIVELSNKQLIAGKNVDGEKMQIGYSSGYGKRRKKAGLQTRFVDLRFSGDYQDSKKGVKVNNGMNIESGVDYEKYLRGNFPKHVGLTSENSEVIAEEIAEEVAVLIDKFLD